MDEKARITILPPKAFALSTKAMASSAMGGTASPLKKMQSVRTVFSNQSSGFPPNMASLMGTMSDTFSSFSSCHVLVL